MTWKAIVVEDNQDMRTAIESYLASEGAAVTGVGSAEDGIDCVDEAEFDIGVIDINLPGKSGFELIEYIRSEGHQYPLIAMTARDGIEDKIKGFDLGLTDYIVKPFDFLELKARIGVHLGRSMADNDVLKTDNFELRLKQHQFLKDVQLVELTNLEMRILEIFMRNNHNLVKVDDLIEHAWGDQPDMLNPPVRIHIANVRKKIGDTDYRILRTVPGIGYIFSDPVEGDGDA